MGSVRRWKGSWQGRARTPDGEQRSRSFENKREAEQWVVEIEAAKYAGTFVDPAAGKVTFSALAEVAQRRPMPSSSAQRLDSHLRNHMLPKWGGRQVASIRRSEIRVWLDELTGSLAPGTVNSLFGMFRGIMALAVDDELIAVNPCDRITPPQPANRAVTPLDDESVARLLDTAEDVWRGLWAVLLGCGLRRNEAMALVVAPGSVDLMRRTVRVGRQITYLGSDTSARSVGPSDVLEVHRPDEYRIGDTSRGFAAPKSKAGRRTIPMSGWVVAEVAEHCQRNGVKPGELLFPIASVQRAWERARLRAELPAGYRMHDLRHCFASAMLNGGANPKMLSEWLGHSTYTLTVDLYGHLMPGDDEMGRQAIDSASRRWAV